MTSAVNLVDSLVRDYLVFRGFSATLKQFEVDSKADKEQGFKVHLQTFFHLWNGNLVVVITKTWLVPFLWFIWFW